MRSLENFIANKKFLMGDQVCNEDASIFGHVAQLINHDRGPLNNFLMSIYVSFISNSYYK